MIWFFIADGWERIPLPAIGYNAVRLNLAAEGRQRGPTLFRAAHDLLYGFTGLLLVPVTRYEVVVGTTPVPMVAYPMMSGVGLDVVARHPDVAAAIPVPVTGRPDVARLRRRRRGFHLRGGRRDVEIDVDASLAQARQGEAAGKQQCGGDLFRLFPVGDPSSMFTMIEGAWLHPMSASLQAGRINGSGNRSGSLGRPALQRSRKR
jgi:hypothetical protein